MENGFQNAGLFLHWGVNTGNDKWEERIPLYNSHEEFEEAVNTGGWTAEKWINTAKKLRASYISLACFHCALGYIKAWRSKIPGTYTTKRDFLGELIEAGKKENIKIVVYISGDTTGKDFYRNAKWIDADAYRKYKNDDSIDIIDHDTWQTVYCRDVIEEMIDNYPDLGGFWFDGWFNKENAEKLFSFIHEKNPKIMNIRNNFGKGYFKDEDLMSIECFGKKCSPSFDIVSGCWQGETDAELCFVMEQISDWWYTGDYPDYYGTDTVKKYITIAANGWRPKVGIGPMVSGDFPENTKRFIDLCDKLLSWAEESLFGIKPGVLPQCYVNDGGYIVTTYKEENKLHYIHVLKAPAGDRLIVKDAGIDFSEAVNLKTGKNISFVQKDGELIFTGDFSACEVDGDVVIKLYEKNERAFAKKIITDEKVLPCEITVKFDRVRKINGLLLKQKNTSVQYNGSWAGVDNNRLKDYSLTVTAEDGSETVIKEGALNGVRGNAQINVMAEGCAVTLKCITAFDTFSSGIYTYNDGWKRLGYDNALSYTVHNCSEYVVTEDGSLNQYENGERTLIDTGVKLVFTGEDSKIYYIKNDGRIINSEGKYDTGFKGERAAADSDGNIYSVSAGVLYKNGEELDRGVTDVCASGDTVEYCKKGCIVTLAEERKIIVPLDYPFIGITHKTFLLENGDVLLRDVKGKEDTYYASGMSDVVCCGEKCFCIKFARRGKCVIEEIDVF